MNKTRKELVPENKPLFGYWQALYRAFFSKRLYIDVGKRWKGFGFIYLLLVVILFSLPLSLYLMNNFNHFYQEQVLDPIKRIPEIYIQNGKVVFNKPMPYKIKNAEGKVDVIIDTTGMVSKISKRYPDLSILIPKDEIFFRIPEPPLSTAMHLTSSGESIYSEKIDKNLNQVFSGDEWVQNSRVHTLRYIFLTLTPLFIISFFYVMLAIMLPVLAFFGQLLAQIFFSFKIPFKKTNRLFIVSSTPALLLFFLVLTLNLKIPAQGILLLIVLFGYFNYAVMILKKESQQVALK